MEVVVATSPPSAAADAESLETSFFVFFGSFWGLGVRVWGVGFRGLGVRFCLVPFGVYCRGLNNYLYYFGPACGIHVLRPHPSGTRVHQKKKKKIHYFGGSFL